MRTPLLFVLLGILLLLVVIGRSSLERIPVNTAMLYLAIGLALGPLGIHWFELRGVEHSRLLMHVAEAAVLISLFASGMKLHFALSDTRWGAPIRLASTGMVVTVALIAALAHICMDLPVGAAIILGAVLAPTDPVLASDVQVQSAADRDALRFGLTGEAGLNDGTAFPFVMLGLGLLGLHELGQWSWRWFAIDLLWATAIGLAVGAVLGTGVGRAVLYLRSRRQSAVGFDEFLALGLIALAYGLALLLHAYGFLAVFAAGLALRRVERGASSAAESGPRAKRITAEEVATHPQTAPAHMAGEMLDFNTQLEHLGEMFVVIIVGVLLSTVVSQGTVDAQVWWNLLWFIPVLFLIIRPAAVIVSLLGAGIARPKRVLMSWFGIRGIGSLYYFMYAVEEGVSEPTAITLLALVLSVVAASVVLHGLSVTPLMARYSKRIERRARQDVRL